jgi:ubiquitin C-terminal hydrolase
MFFQRMLAMLISRNALRQYCLNDIAGRRVAPSLRVYTDLQSSLANRDRDLMLRSLGGLDRLFLTWFPTGMCLDIHECVLKVLDRLEDAIANSFLGNGNIITELFQVTQRKKTSTTCCPNNWPSIQDKDMGLTLGLSESGTISLIDLLTPFGKDEELTGPNKWRCPCCKTLVDATMVTHLQNLPPVLIIGLKRFRSGTGGPIKISTKGTFSHVLQIPKDACAEERPVGYRLFAVAEHCGSVVSGHYIAYVRQQDETWYSCSDEWVERVTSEYVETVPAYLLLFER